MYRHSVIYNGILYPAGAVLPDAAAKTTADGGGANDNKGTGRSSKNGSGSK